MNIPSYPLEPKMICDTSIRGWFHPPSEAPIRPQRDVGPLPILPLSYRAPEGEEFPAAYYQADDVDLLTDIELKEWLDDHHEGEEVHVFVDYGPYHVLPPLDATISLPSGRKMKRWWRSPCYRLGQPIGAWFYTVERPC